MLAALSIDLDGLAHYHRIHGLPPPAGDDADPVYGKAIDRFGALCGRLGIRGTAFCVGRNLRDDPRAAGAARRLADEGHELGNHSLSHDYRLTTRSREEIAREVQGGAEAIEAVAGAAPVGFRAPGYTLCPALVEALVAAGYRYDSSAFPSPPYYAAKAIVMALLATTGRPSGALLDRPGVLRAPRVPYRPSARDPYRRGSVPLLELPITTGLLGAPLVGTFVGTLPPPLMRALRAGTGRRPLFNLELHGIDLLDASDASPALAARQRDLRVPATVKVARIDQFVRALSDRSWVTLSDAARRLAASGDAW